MDENNGAIPEAQEEAKGYVPPVEDLKYSIGELNSNEPKASIIEKRGAVLNFTMNDLEANLEKLRKMEKELSGNLELQEAKRLNYEHHHPVILTLSEEDQYAIFLYYEARALINSSSNKLAEVREQIEKDEAERSEILSQIPEVGKTPKLMKASRFFGKKKRINKKHGR